MAQLLVSDPRLRCVWQAVHDRLCAGAPAETIRSVTIDAAESDTVALLRLRLDTPRQRAAGTTSMPATQRGVRVPISRLRTDLHIDVDTMVTAAVNIGGPIHNRAVARADAAAAREELWTYAADRLPGCPQLVARWRAAGVGDDNIDAVRTAIDAIATCLAAAPFGPPVALPTAAWMATTEPHFFDRPTDPASAGGRLVSAIAETYGHPAGRAIDGLSAHVPGVVDDVLATVGIIKDRLSATVVAFNLPLLDSSGERWTRPVVSLNAYTVTVDPPTPQVNQVLVSENPSLIEHAIQHRWEVAMICTQGMFRSVDHAVLQWLVDHGVYLIYIGDADEHGQLMSTMMVDRYGVDVVALPAGTMYQEDPRALAVAYSALRDELE